MTNDCSTLVGDEFLDRPGGGVNPMSWSHLPHNDSKSVDYEAVCGSTVVLHIFSVFVNPFYYA